MSRINPGPLKQCDALADEEQLMLDALEASTGRLTRTAGAMNDEAAAQVALLNGMDRDAENNADRLHAEARKVDTVRTAKKGVCWMYVCIAVEASVLVLLVYVGLS